MIWFYLAILGIGVLLFYLMQQQPMSHRTVDKDMVQQRWNEVETGVKQTGASRKQAVIDADKLLDYVLKRQGFAGHTMAERLKKAETKLSDKNAVWQAHKLRNRLVHEPQTDLMGDMGKRDVAAIKHALRDLGVKV